MIILTAEQAETVRGETVAGHVLEPVPLADGTFVLPEAVLSDPAHAQWHDLLAGLPVRDVAREEFAPAGDA